MKQSICLSVTLSLLLSMLAACQAAVSPSTPSKTTVPVDFSSLLGSATLIQSGEQPDYTIKAETPVIDDGAHPGAAGFNQAASQAVQREIEAFRQGLPDPETPQVAAGSSFDLTFVQLTPPGHLISLQLKINKFIDGAAHPFDYTVAFNYDLANGRELSLDQLFVPGSNYLQVISAYCENELNKTELASVLLPEGFSSEPENFRSWNISIEGLMITFDASQVAAYAAGPQVVVVSYAVLKDIIDPQGPLGAISR
jgi:hypothetical protein